MSEFNEREEQRNIATEGTSREQFEKYMNRWKELWRNCQIKDREEDVEEHGEISMIQKPGAIPLQEWENYLNTKISQGDMYTLESILQIMEQIAVNGDYKKALEIFDELYVSSSDLNQIAKDVIDYLPDIPSNISSRPDIGKERIEAKHIFELRANESAHLERLFIKMEDDSWLYILNHDEARKREEQRNIATEGTSREQFEKYMNRWKELWRKCQIKDREEDVEEHGEISIIQKPGAIPLQEWENYLNTKISQGDMYTLESILQIMEQIAVNGDYKKALEIFDELYVSSSDLNQIAKDVIDYLPDIPSNISSRPDIGKERIEAKHIFELRANEGAHLERLFIKKEIRSREAAKKVEKTAIINALKGTSATKADEAKVVEQTNENVLNSENIK